MIDGLLVVDKPAGWTRTTSSPSSAARRGSAAIGHAGTLDPDATGVLLVGLGRVTRLLRFLQETTKEYRGVVAFGVATTRSTPRARSSSRTRCRSPRPRSAPRWSAFVGDIEQVPPMVSALKVGGRRLHELAREGKEVERAPRPGADRPVRARGVHAGRRSRARRCTSSARAAPTSGRSPPISVPRSAGTRTWRRCAGCRVGAFTLADATELDALVADPGAVRPRAGGGACGAWSRSTVDADVAALVAHGAGSSATRRSRCPAPGPYARRRTTPATLLAVYERVTQRLKPSVVLPVDARATVGENDLMVDTGSYAWATTPRSSPTAASSPSARTTACTTVTARCSSWCASSPTPATSTRCASPSTAIRRRSCDPRPAPTLLTTLDHKLELLVGARLLDVVCVLEFDEGRSKESAEDFVHEVLVGLLGARLVVVGADFHFGHRRGGNVALLERMGADLGFEVIGLGLVAPESDPVHEPYSSTRVRHRLAAGDVAGAAELLGRPHEVRGVVVEGDRRGRELGFPTANVALTPDTCLPADGIYAGRFRGADGVWRPAAISLGRRPTFYGDQERSLLEAYLLDFDGDLYGQDGRRAVRRAPPRRAALRLGRRPRRPDAPRLATAPRDPRRLSGSGRASDPRGVGHGRRAGAARARRRRRRVRRHERRVVVWRRTKPATGTVMTRASASITSPT